jgi:RNA polymerase sigma-70 factor (ECF subfamily)
VHLSAVYHSARRLARREDEARDLVQDTMLRAYRAFDGFTPGTNARAWLLTILYSVFVNQYRRTAREPAQVSIEELEARHAHELAAAEVELPDPFGGTWSEAAVEAAVAELPEAFRLTVLLVDVDDLSYEEAAKVLGCEIGTVRSRLFRARRLLAASLTDFARQRGLVRGKAESE